MYLRPDNAANNNLFDLHSAQKFYDKCQALGVSLVTLSRHATQKVSISRHIFDRLASTGATFGRCTLTLKKIDMVKLAVKAISAKSSHLREGLPGWCNERWFSDKFCGGKLLPRDLRDRILSFIANMEQVEPRVAIQQKMIPECLGLDLWNRVTQVSLYDAINILCAVPYFRRKFFRPYENDVGGVIHYVVGKDEHDDGVPNPDTLCNFLSHALLKGVSVHHRHTRSANPLVLISDPGQDLDDEMAFIMLRSLEDSGWLKLEALITNLYPSSERARLAHGTLVELGWSEKEASHLVAVGSDGGCTSHDASAFSNNAHGAPTSPQQGSDSTEISKTADELAMSAESYMPTAAPSWTGQEKLLDVYKRAKNSSVVMVLISSLKDAAMFLQKHEDLFAKKTRHVCIMGGKEIKSVLYFSTFGTV